LEASHFAVLAGQCVAWKVGRFMTSDVPVNI